MQNVIDIYTFFLAHRGDHTPLETIFGVQNFSSNLEVGQQSEGHKELISRRAIMTDQRYHHMFTNLPVSRTCKKCCHSLTAKSDCATTCAASCFVAAAVTFHRVSASRGGHDPITVYCRRETL